MDVHIPVVRQGNLVLLEFSHFFLALDDFPNSFTYITVGNGIEFLKTFFLNKYSVSPRKRVKNGTYSYFKDYLVFEKPYN